MSRLSKAKSSEHHPEHPEPTVSCPCRLMCFGFGTSPWQIILRAVFKSDADFSLATFVFFVGVVTSWKDDDEDAGLFFEDGGRTCVIVFGLALAPDKTGSALRFPLAFSWVLGRDCFFKGVSHEVSMAWLTACMPHPEFESQTVASIK